MIPSAARTCTQADNGDDRPVGVARMPSRSLEAASRNGPVGLLDRGRPGQPDRQVGHGSVFQRHAQATPCNLPASSGSTSPIALRPIGASLGGQPVLSDGTKAPGHLVVPAPPNRPLARHTGIERCRMLRRGGRHVVQRGHRRRGRGRAESHCAAVGQPRGRPARRRIGCVARISLVLGSHGHGRLHRAVLGSVSGECARQARCPVVIIPTPHAEKVKEPAEPVAATP